MKRVFALVLVVSTISITTLLSVNAQAGWLSWLFKDNYTKTQYPIVLVHGILGFDDILGVDYFYRVPHELSKSGATVFTPAVAALESTEARGEQLARQVEEIIAITGKQKVNLIGHSHGGPTVRYVASVYPEMVASASSVGGSHLGSRLADIILGVSDAVPLGDELVSLVADAFAGAIDLISGGGYEQNSMASFYSNSSEGAAAFNVQHPEGMPTTYCGEGAELASNGVRYYSWAGTSPLTNILDVSDVLLAVTSLGFLGEDNDGIVQVCSTHWGKVLRDDYRMNHFDQMNHLFGLHSYWDTDPVTIYRQHANRLKNLGL